MGKSKLQIFGKIDTDVFIELKAERKRHQVLDQFNSKPEIVQVIFW